MDDDRLYNLLTRLMALSPEGDAGRNALVREVCAQAVSLPPLVAQVRPMTTLSSPSSPSSSPSTCP
jgi:hypothetical protein